MLRSKFANRRFAFLKKWDKYLDKEKIDAIIGTRKGVNN